MKLFRPSIISLLFSSSPSAMVRRIVFMVIYSVKSLIKWAFSHIGEEWFKFPPSNAHCNSASAVIFPLLKSWISAALNHMLPRFICLGRWLPPQRMSMFYSRTATRFIPTKAKHYACGNDLITAIANTIPMNDSPFMRRLADDNQTPITIATLILFSVWRFSHVA